jgi:cation transport ATPase
LSFAALSSWINALGFQASLKGEEESTDYSHAHAIRFWRNNFLFSLLFFIPLQVIMLMHPTMFLMSEAYPGVSVMNIFMLSIGTIVLVVVGRPFMVAGFKALLHRAPNMDSLIFISVRCVHADAWG